MTIWLYHFIYSDTQADAERGTVFVVESTRASHMRQLANVSSGELSL